MSSSKTTGVAVDVDHLVRSHGERRVLDGISLHIEAGELAVLVGPSGCGKSTLLRAIAGLDAPDGGTIRIGGRDVTRLPPGERDIGMVFQSYALYPHLTVYDNLAFALSLRKTPPAEIRARVDEAATMLGLRELYARKPGELSGGQRQRVAMGRAMVRRPSIFLFDEPLSNLDAALRAQLRVELHELHAKLGSTMIYVTHDQIEAMTLADRIFVLNQGRIEQTAPPSEVYDRPATRFVARFLGTPEINLLPTSAAPMLEASLAAPAGAVEVGVRPEDLRLTEDGAPNATVEIVEPLGWETLCHLRLGETRLVARLVGDRAPQRGASVVVRADATRLHFFDGTGRRL